MNNIKEKTIKSLSLKMIERLLNSCISLVISIILARIITPYDYGLVALMNIFVSILNTFAESGLGVGLVQKKEITDTDVSTAFWSVLLISIISYLVIFIIAPILETFFMQKNFANVLRIYSLIIIVSSISSIPNSLSSRNYTYHYQFISSVVSTIVSGIVGIVMAIYGFGVWALVCQQAINKTVYLFLIIISTKFVPKFKFSFLSYKTIFGFTWRIVLTRFVMNIYNQARSFVIGKIYNSDALAYYNKGNQVPAEIATATDYSFQSVMFSTYSKYQDDVVQLKRMVRRTMKLNSYVLFPVLMGIAAVADPLVRILLTEKWISSVPFMRIACLVYAIQPISTANSQAINSLGKSNTTLKIEIANKIFSTLLISITLFINIESIAWSAFAAALFESLLFMHANKTILSYGIKEQIIDLLPSAILVAVMYVCLYIFTSLQINVWISLFGGVCIGIVIYIGGSYIFKLESLFYLVELINSKLHNHKKM